MSRRLSSSRLPMLTLPWSSFTMRLKVSVNGGTGVSACPDADRRKRLSHQTGWVGQASLPVQIRQAGMPVPPDRLGGTGILACPDQTGRDACPTGQEPVPPDRLNRLVDELSIL